MKKLFDTVSRDRQRAKNQQNYKGRPSFTSVSTRTRESTPASVNNYILPFQKIHQGVEYSELNRSRLKSLPATKNHQDLIDSEDESNGMILSLPDYETGQQSYPAPTDAKAATARKRW